MVGVSWPDELERLTSREAEILELVPAGLTNAAIAERLWISPGTVKKHLDNIYAKLGVANRTAAVAWTRDRRV
jgi:DNA-binding NarL/FixJ family response regulator